MNDGVILHTRGLSKRFGGLQAVRDVTLQLRRGQVTGIIGPNGAGKTTLFNLISGFLRPDAGEIVYQGRPITGLPPYRMAGLGIVRTFQDVRLFQRLTTLENVLLAFQHQMGEHPLRLFAQWRRVDAHERLHRQQGRELLRSVGLEHKARDLAENLSYGQQKRLAIARLLAAGAEMLLLDEPAAGLDPEAVPAMNGLVRWLIDAGKTVCLVEHNLDVVEEICDRVVCLDQGSVLVEGTPSDVLKNAKVVEAYLGIRP